MNPLVLSDEQYREVFEQITQRALAYVSSIPERRILPAASGSDTEALFRKPLPEHGMGVQVLDDLGLVIDNVRVAGPGFFGYVLGSGEPVAAAADLLASVLNQNVTAWRSGPSAATVERVVVGWLAEAIGCQGFTGSLTGGGSSANLMALAMAREARLPANEAGARPGTVYASEQVHMSIPKAIALLGIGRDNLRLIPCDDQFRIRIDLVRQTIEKDIRAGVTPIAVVGSAGTVATGSIDDINRLAEIAQGFDAWFHVDGAYGALAAIAEPAKFLGMNRADSMSLDPHKWLYQPLDCGCLLFRDAAAAQRAFSHTGDYAKSLIDDPVEGFVFFEESMELSRRFRALKLWLSLRYHGMGNFREAMRNDLAMAQHLAECIANEARLELSAPVALSAVCFRYLPQAGGDSDKLNQEILRGVNRRGRVFLSNASIYGKFALRACIVNHRTTASDVERVVSEVLEVGREMERVS
ncbi:MAG: pyridoxal-dependent decarboxylase [Acidobacteriota bacterium]|nr:pyridoxal-dependent decarboxylase [Acidobacteriota bacterium]